MLFTQSIGFLEKKEELFAYPAHASGARLLHAPDILLQRLRPLFQRLRELQHAMGIQRDLVQQYLVRAVLHEIRLFVGPAARPHHPAIARALALIERRLCDRELSLADLVQAADCSRTVFVERFTADLGLPPMRYVEEQRLHLAAYRLHQDSDTITMIARDLGFGSPQYFATRFRRRFGCTPQEHRAGAHSA